MLAPDLVAILVCPRTRQPLVYFPRGEDDRDEAAGFLLCPSARLRYRIEAGVPVLLAEEAEVVPAVEVERLIAVAGRLGLPVPSI